MKALINVETKAGWVEKLRVVDPNLSCAVVGNPNDAGLVLTVDFSVGREKIRDIVDVVAKELKGSVIEVAFDFERALFSIWNLATLLDARPTAVIVDEIYKDRPVGAIIITKQVNLFLSLLQGLGEYLVRIISVRESAPEDVVEVPDVSPEATTEVTAAEPAEAPVEASVETQPTAQEVTEVVDAGDTENTSQSESEPV